MSVTTNLSLAKSARRLALTLSLAAFVATGLSPAVSAQSVMKLASATVNDGQHEWLKVFADELKKRVGDKVKTEIYPASQLGAIPRMAEGVLLGTIESFITPTSFMTSSDPRLTAFDEPGLFDSPEHADKVLRDPAYREHAAVMSLDHGIRIIGLMYAAKQAILTHKQIKTLADLKGLKMRTFATPLQIEPMKSLGTLPIPMALSEVMAQLQNHGIDGMIGGMTVFVPFKYYDAAKYVTEFNFAPVISITTVNEKWFQSQPKDVQAAITAAGWATDDKMLAWNLANFERIDKIWVANKGEIGKLSDEEFKGMVASFREIGAKIIAQTPTAKVELDKILAVAAAKRGK